MASGEYLPAGSYGSRYIRDNGRGMDAAEYAGLMARLDKEGIGDFQEQNESIGILNIHYRLKLIFGASYRLIYLSMLMIS